MKKNHFIIHDQILKYLSDNSDKFVTFKDINENALLERKSLRNYMQSFVDLLFKSKTDRFYADIFKNHNNPNIVSDTIYFLKQGGFVNYNKSEPIDKMQVEITHKGLEKINTLTFRKQYLKENRSFWFEIVYKILLPILALATIGVTIYININPKK